MDDGRAPATLAVVGPCAEDPRTLLGCYSFPAHVLPQHPGTPMGIDVPSVLDALRAAVRGAGSTVVHERGCAVADDDRSGIAAAADAARGADACVLVVGDRSGLFGRGTSGEGCDAEDLSLPGVQGELVEAVLATGTPVVVVVVSGRPYALGAVTGRASAVLQAFLPGQEGAAAVAEVLTGRVNPSGRLPVQVSRTPGGQPATYLRARLAGGEEALSSIDPTPLFAFGHGLSYTTYAYDDLRVSSTEPGTDGLLELTCRVRNTGDRAGEEVVQLYAHDPVAQVTRPVVQLLGFARVALDAGSAADVAFSVHADRFAFTGLAGRRVVEPGEVQLMVGRSSTDLPLRCAVTLQGPQRDVGADRVLDVPVRVTPLPAG
jgi:beta-glucosidase